MALEWQFHRSFDARHLGLEGWSRQDGKERNGGEVGSAKLVVLVCCPGYSAPSSAVPIPPEPLIPLAVSSPTIGSPKLRIGDGKNA
jgi:hypothetical protein